MLHVVCYHNRMQLISKTLGIFLLHLFIAGNIKHETHRQITAVKFDIIFHILIIFLIIN